MAHGLTNPLPFELADSAFKNAATFRLEYRQIPPSPDVEEILQEIAGWFGVLGDTEGEGPRLLKRQLWQLRVAVLYGLLPFDSGALAIADLADQIASRAHQYPDLRTRSDCLLRVATSLVGSPINPKRQVLRSDLQRLVNQGRSVGLILALVRNHLPALTQTVEDLQSIGKSIYFVSSRRQYLASTFDHVIIPFSTHNCALTKEILYAYRASTARVIYYPSERPPSSSSKLRLPAPIPASRVPEFPSPPQAPSPPAPDPEIWSFIGPEKPPEVADTDYYVPARTLLLANSHYVLLREDSKALELSDLVEGRLSLDDLERRLPRKPVRDLRQGDLIVLRVRGSGDYLIEVADDLMRADGRRGLRTSAVDWKPPLRGVLARRGSKWFLNQLQKRGFHLAAHDYLWKWTTEEVIGPQSKSHFYETIAILEDCGWRFSETDVLQAARRRWKEMRQLRNYHRKAGQRIRGILLTRLRAIIDTRPTIGSEYQLEVPGVAAGAMALVRIAAVDSRVRTVPFNHIAVPIPILDNQAD